MVIHQKRKNCQLKKAHSLYVPLHDYLYACLTIQLFQKKEFEVENQEKRSL